MEILRNSQEIANAIRKLLSDKTEKHIIAVAYVGADAISYLAEDPKDLKQLSLYCSTAIPGTNPSSLRKLKKSGVIISKVDKLHSKVYWSKSQGVVICSANLSNNGLAGNVNHEVGVLLPSDSFDVSAYVTELPSVILTDRDIEVLEREYNLYMLRNPQTGPQGNTETQDFSAWNGETGPNWKMFDWSVNAAVPGDVANRIAIQHPSVNQAGIDYIVSARSDAYELGGWVLEFREDWNGNELLSVTDLQWFIPVERIRSEDPYDEDYPYYWIKLRDWIPTPQPFSIDDRFVQLFNDVYVGMKNRGEDVIFNNRNPRIPFINALRDA